MFYLVGYIYPIRSVCVTLKEMCFIFSVLFIHRCVFTISKKNQKHLDLCLFSNFGVPKHYSIPKSVFCWCQSLKMLIRYMFHTEF